MKIIVFIRVFALCLLSSTCSVNAAASTGAPTKNNEDAIGMRLSFDKCIDRSGAVTFKILDCIHVEHAYQDKRLNKAYKTLMSTLSESVQVKLREEEKKWIAYRDSYCALAPDGGQGQRMDSASCFLMETAKQASTLEAHPGQPAVLTLYEGATNGLRPTYIKCIKMTRGTGQESQRCMDAEYTYQNTRLNKTYQTLTAKLGESEQAKLRADQKIWIAFRDTHCAWALDGGQSPHPASNDCSVEETAKQARALEIRLYFMN